MSLLLFFEVVSFNMNVYIYILLVILVFLFMDIGLFPHASLFPISFYQSILGYSFWLLIFFRKENFTSKSFNEAPVICFASKNGLENLSTFYELQGTCPTRLFFLVQIYLIVSFAAKKVGVAPMRQFF